MNVNFTMRKGHQYPLNLNNYHKYSLIFIIGHIDFYLKYKYSYNFSDRKFVCPKRDMCNHF